MRKAKYEILKNNEGYYGEIPGFQGVWSNADNLEDCRNELAEVLEGWVVLHLRDNNPLPDVDGLHLSFERVAEAV